VKVKGSGGYSARLAGFGVLLVGLLAGPVIANAFAEEPTLPTAAQVKEGLERAEREEAEREAELASPAAVEEREDSAGAYDDVSPGEAIALLKAQFPEQLAIINGDPARFLSDATLTDAVGDGSVGQVTSDGSAELLDAGIPVEAEEGGGDFGKVDLTLVDAGDGFEPVNPLTEVSIPDSADGEIAVGEDGLSIASVGTAASDALPFGDKNLFYPEAQTDTDLLVSPIASGVEISEQLRSPDSPEVLRYDVDLPANSELRPDGNGGAEVVRGAEVLARVPFPTAVDAQGTDVPVEMTVDGTTLVLSVPHREEDFAYPILVDPALVEDWYNASWYSGYNLGALTDGTWSWSTNTNWVYGSTSCIWTCWGSGRGLYVSTESGWHGAGQWGQWAYSPPGATSYITSALINPFWRNNYANCPKSLYPQPHDYDGLWTGSGWSPLETNRANDYGNAQPTGWGRSLIIGMGNAGAAENKCRRDIMAGGVAVWISDNEVPTLNKPTVADQWMYSTALAVNNYATDPGLGVKYFKLFTTNPDGSAATEVGNATHGCSGLRSNPCPSAWSANITNYSPAGLSTGVNKMVVKAYDALGLEHYSQGQPVLLKVDRVLPTITVTGDMLSEKPVKYHLDVTGTDGNSSSFGTAQSGMKSLQFYFDGQLVGRFPETTTPPNCTNVQQGIDMGSCEFKNVGLDFNRGLTGQHTFKVVATDSVNRSSEKTIQLNLPQDTTAPTVTPSGPLYQAANTWSAAQESTVTVNASDVETGIVEAKLLIDGAQVGQATQECFYGGCSLSKTFTVPLQSYSDGPHTVKLVAKDAAGNLGESSWTIKRDATAPNLTSLTAPGLPAGWTPQQSTVNLDYTATDASSGVKKLEVVKPLVGGTTESTFPYNSFFCGGEGSPCPGTKEGTASVSTGNVAQGEVKLLVKAHDASGNVSAAQAVTLKIDRSAPQVSATGPLVSARSGETLGLSSDLGLKVQDKGSGVSTVELLLDGVPQSVQGITDILEAGGSQTCSGESCAMTYDWTAIVGEGASSGTHTFAVVTKDLAGRSTTVSHQVVLDTRPPTVTLDGPLTEVEGEELPGTTALLEAAADDGPGSTGITRIAVEVDGVPVEPRVDLWVVDKSNNRIQGFNDKGQFVTSFGSFGSGNGQFNRPASVAIDNAGNIWVADANNHRIQKFNEKGEYLSKFGSYGTAGGQFNGPEGVAIDGAGNVWVSDTYNGRIQKFSPQGEFLKVVSSKGSGVGQLGEPTGIDVAPDGKIWVADWQNNRVAVFTAEGAFVRQFGSAGSGNGQFNRPDEVDVDGKGRVWVGDQNNGRIQQFTEAGIYVTKFGSVGSGTGQFSFSYPMGVAVDAKDRVWIADTNNNRVQKWLARSFTSSYVGTFASPNRPGDVALDAQGNIWSVSTQGNQVRKYSPQGQLLFSFGGAGSTDGKFNGPAALTIDSSGNIWVADRFNNRIQKFTPQGEFLLKFGTAGSGNGQFNGPEGVAIDQKGNVWVSDTYNGRVQKFNALGQFLSVAVANGSAQGQITEPVGIDVAPDGNMWIADWQGERVVVVNEEGGFVRQFGSLGTGPGQFQEPDGIDVDVHGNVWVGDSNNERVQQFDLKGNYIAQFGTAGAGEGQFSFSYPMGLEADASGNIWIADTENNRIQNWTAPVTEPKYASSFGSAGSGNGQLNKPADVAVTALAPCQPGLCPQTATKSFTYDEAVWGAGPRSVVVTATDAAGNTTSEEVRVNESLSAAVAPSCPTSEAQTVSGGEAQSTAAAIAAVEAALPAALDASVPLDGEEESEETAEENPVAPSVTRNPEGVSLNNQGIDVVDSAMGGGIEDDTAGDFTVGQAVCLQPLQVGGQAAQPTLVNGAAVVYPNAAPDTTTVIRPTTLGTTVIEHLHGEDAPTAFSWAVALQQGQELKELSNGSVAIVDPEGMDVPTGTVPPEPEGGWGLNTLNEAEAQLEEAERDLAIANNEVEGEVVTVIATPDAVLTSGEVVPGILKITGGTVVTAELPPNYVAEVEAMIIKANPPAEPEDICAMAFADAPQYYHVVCQREPYPATEAPAAGDPIRFHEAYAHLGQPVRGQFEQQRMARLNLIPDAIEDLFEEWEGLSDEVKALCLKNPDRCLKFLREDARKVTELEEALFNVPAGSADTKQNAFKHALWTLMMEISSGYNQHGIIFAEAYEGKDYNDGDHPVRKKASQSDMVNDKVGWLNNNEYPQKDVTACNDVLSKIGAAIDIGTIVYPYRWVKRNDYVFYNLIYRKARDLDRPAETGKVVVRNGRTCPQVFD
jgi:sugar lactone lactonase YvrE